MVASFLIAVPSLGQSGGNYELTRCTISGGGETCAGGDFILDVVIGQPEGGSVAGGNFEVGSGLLCGGPFCLCVGDMNGDGWLSPIDISALISKLLPHKSSYYWVQCP